MRSRESLFPHSVGQGKDVDLLFGLDMLKAHQACIDLEKGVLRIQGREVKFIAEHELPDKDRIFESGDHQEPGSQPPRPDPSNSTPTVQNQGSSFPGQGHTLGVAPRAQAKNPQPQSQQSQTQQSPPPSRYPESTIRSLMDLGATREEAIRFLDQSGGNVDMAASLMF